MIEVTELQLIIYVLFSLAASYIVASLMSYLSDDMQSQAFHAGLIMMFIVVSVFSPVIIAFIPEG